MKNFINLVVILLVSSLTGCASQSALDNVRNDIDSIKTRLYSIDRDFNSIRE